MGLDRLTRLLASRSIVVKRDLQLDAEPLDASKYEYELEHPTA